MLAIDATLTSVRLTLDLDDILDEGEDKLGDDWMTMMRTNLTMSLTKTRKNSLI
jgi:hypothetical protein